MNDLIKQRSRPVIVSGVPTFEFPDSQLVSASQIYEDSFQYWRDQLGWGLNLDRKVWEYTYIVNAISKYFGKLDGLHGLGFGVGVEKIPSLLVKHGCTLTVTDYVPESNKSKGWESTKIDDLIFTEILDEDTLRKSAKFIEVDMNDIPDSLSGYDFLWSTGSLEHIGSRKHGLDFIKSSLKCLKSGGYAIHTTEFTITSKTKGFDSPDLNFYCQNDIENLALELIECGHRIVLNFNRGDTVADLHVDTPPFHHGMTLTAHFGNHVITSIGLIIQKSLD